MVVVAQGTKDLLGPRLDQERNRNKLLLHFRALNHPKRRNRYVSIYESLFPSKHDAPLLLVTVGVFAFSIVLQFILRNGGKCIIFPEGKGLGNITHLVVAMNDLNPRCTEFLAALCVCPERVVVYDWIQESTRKNKFLCPEKFHITSKADDFEAIEGKCGLSMKTSFDRAITALKDGGILFGKGVYVGPGVIGYSGPSEEEVSVLVKASGAVHHNDAELEEIVNEGDVTKLMVITKRNNEKVPVKVAMAVLSGATELSWADFQNSVLKQGFTVMDKSSQLPLIDEKHVIDVTQKTTTQQEEGSQSVKILSIELDDSPTRSISNPAIGEPERASLGQNGSFEIYKFVGSLRTVARYVNKDGRIKFEALVPSPDDCFKAIQGNAGRQYCFFWDACNTAFASGGTTIQGVSDPSSAVALRRYFFWFNCKDDLKLALFHMFGQCRELVDEFFDKKGKFFASKITLPDHTVVKPYAGTEEVQPLLRSGYFGDSSQNYAYDPRCESRLWS